MQLRCHVEYLIVLWQLAAAAAAPNRSKAEAQVEDFTELWY